MFIIKYNQSNLSKSMDKRIWSRSDTIFKTSLKNVQNNTQCTEYTMETDVNKVESLRQFIQGYVASFEVLATFLRIFEETNGHQHISILDG